MANLDENPAIAAYRFQKCWEIFYEEVVKLQLGVVQAAGRPQAPRRGLVTVVPDVGGRILLLWTIEGNSGCTHTLRLYPKFELLVDVPSDTDVSI